MNDRVSHLLRFALSPLLAALLALSCILAVPDTSVAQKGSSDRVRAQEIFQRGQGYFEEGRYSEAAVEFLNAFQLDPHPAIMYNVARAHEEMGKLVRALQYYRVALSLKPSAAVKEELERKIAEIELVLRADGVDVLNLEGAEWVPKGKVSIQSDPPGAEIIINGQAAGRTPLDARVLPQGEYRIVVKKRGFAPEERELSVVGGKTYLLNARLRPGDESGPAQKGAMGMIDISADQRGLTVFLDGEPLATTPVGQIEATPGPHTVTIEGEGFPAFEQTVEVETGKTARVVVRRFEPKPLNQPSKEFLDQSDWGWVAVGTGGGFVGLGAILGVVALSNASDYNDLRSSRERAQLHDSARLQGVLADVSYGLGVALLTTGALLIAFDDGIEGGGDTEDGPQRPAYYDDLVMSPRLELIPLPGGAALGASGRW